MFGERLKTLRTKAGLSQKALATKLFISQQAVAQWEQEKGSPNPETLLQIAKILNVSADYLLGNTDKKEKPAPEGGRETSEEEIRAAFFGGADDLSEEEMVAMWNDAKDYIQYKLEQRRRRGNGGLD